MEDSEYLLCLLILVAIRRLSPIAQAVQGAGSLEALDRERSSAS